MWLFSVSDLIGHGFMSASFRSPAVRLDSDVFIYLSIIHESSQVAEIFGKTSCWEGLCCSGFLCSAMCEIWIFNFSFRFTWVEPAKLHLTESQAAPVFLVAFADDWDVCHHLRGTQQQPTQALFTSESIWFAVCVFVQDYSSSCFPALDAPNDSSAFITFMFSEQEWYETVIVWVLLLRHDWLLLISLLLLYPRFIHMHHKRQKKKTPSQTWSIIA